MNNIYDEPINIELKKVYTDVMKIYRKNCLVFIRKRVCKWIYFPLIYHSFDIYMNSTIVYMVYKIILFLIKTLNDLFC